MGFPAFSIGIICEEEDVGKRWTDKDVDNLKRLGQRYATPKIAEIMDRTVGSIVFKAHALEIPLRTRQQEAQMSAREAKQPAAPN